MGIYGSAVHCCYYAENLRIWRSLRSPGVISLFANDLSTVISGIYCGIRVEQQILGVLHYGKIIISFDELQIFCAPATRLRTEIMIYEQQQQLQQLFDL